MRGDPRRIPPGALILIAVGGVTAAAMALSGAVGVALAVLLFFAAMAAVLCVPDERRPPR